jgi:hypothetical protein
VWIGFRRFVHLFPSSLLTFVGRFSFSPSRAAVNSIISPYNLGSLMLDVLDDSRFVEGDREVLLL